MTIGEIHDPQQCIICGYYLTTHPDYADRRCLDPAHWQAAGLAPRDFYSLALIMAANKTPQPNQKSVKPR